MATPTHDEIQDFYKEETEYQTAQDKFEDDYPEIVITGNADDNDDDNNEYDSDYNGDEDNDDNDDSDDNDDNDENDD